MRHPVSPLLRARKERITPPQLARRGGFTLIEVLVAIGIFSLMLTIVFVPLNLGLKLFQAGRARAEVQQASQATLAQMRAEFAQAVYVFPNSIVPGVTTMGVDGAGADACPFDFCRGKDSGGAFYNREGRPYFRVNQDKLLEADVLTPTQGTCNAKKPSSPSVPPEPDSNLARIDFLLPELTPAGVVKTPITPAKYVVSYYARRLDITKSYDPVDNPIVLFRAQYPYRWQNNASTPNVPEVRTDSLRYADQGTDCSSSVSNKDSAWLLQSKYGEPNLEPLCRDSDLILDGTNPSPDAGSANPPVVGSHTLLTPRGMGLITPNADPEDPKDQSYIPNTSFVPEDTNGDGKIDRVTVKMDLAQFDGVNDGKRGKKGQPAAQSIQSQVAIDLPNVR